MDWPGIECKMRKSRIGPGDAKKSAKKVYRTKVSVLTVTGHMKKIGPHADPTNSCCRYRADTTTALLIMSKLFRIVGISGSLRKESWNTKLLTAFAVASRDPEFTQQGVQFEIADWSKYSHPNYKTPLFHTPNVVV